MYFIERVVKGKLIYPILALTLIFSSCELEEKKEEPQPIAEQPAPEPQNPDECLTKAAADNGTVIAGQYIVRYKNGASTNNLPDVLSKIAASGKFKKLYENERFQAALAKISAQEAEGLKNDPAIESIEPDRVISIVSCNTSIPAQSVPWGIQRVGRGNGLGKTVWVIDTGVDLDHPDLTVDASRSKSYVEGTTPDDDHGHGSHVAGTIAAKDNSLGVVGVAAGATVVAMKVMDYSGKGSNSNVIAAVNYIAKNGKAGDVVNMSLGGGQSLTLDQAVKDAAAKGILFAIAAGNDAVDIASSSPARVNAENVFTVSAMNSEDTYAHFSNYGNGIDYCAPGVNIPSTHKNGGYATMSGTSMATPHIAGLLLLNGKNIPSDGYVKDDPDGRADPIGHK